MAVCLMTHGLTSEASLEVGSGERVLHSFCIPVSLLRRMHGDLAFLWSLCPLLPSSLLIQHWQILRSCQTHFRGFLSGKLSN